MKRVSLDIVERKVMNPFTGVNYKNLAIVGEAPGAEEVRAGKPFVGPSGKMLDSFLSEVGSSRSMFFITNVVTFRPPGNRKPTLEEIVEGLPRLALELRQAGVKKVLTVGATAMQALRYGGIPTKKIGASRGAWIEVDVAKFDGGESYVIKVMPTWHPAYVLRSPSHGTEFLTDLIKFFDNEKATRELPKKVTTIVRSLQHLKETIPCIPDVAVFDFETGDIDGETTGVRFWRSKLLALAFSWSISDTIQCVVIIRELFEDPEAMKLLSKAFKERTWIGHNVYFDVNLVVQYFGVQNPKVLDDTMLMHYALEEQRGTHGLKELARTMYDAPNWEGNIHKYLKRVRKDTYEKIPPDELYEYAAFDVYYTWLLLKDFKPLLKEKGLYEWPYKNLIMQMAWALNKAEQAGIEILPENLAAAEIEFKRRMLHIQAKLDNALVDEGLHQFVGMSPNSPKKCAEVIFDHLQFKPPRLKGKQRKKPRCTDKDVLARLPKHPITDAIVAYRRARKLLNTYVTKLPYFVDEQGRAHFGFRVHGTISGRISAGMLLTVPRAFKEDGKIIRDCFGSSKGLFMSADYSQAELRLAAAMSCDPFLLDVYRSGRDLHTEVAVKLYGKNWTREGRIQAKMLNFSNLYSVAGATHAFADHASLPIEQAKQVVKRYNETLKGLTRWKGTQFELLCEQGYIENPFGRRRRFSTITNINYSDAKKASVNAPVSSGVSDATHLAFVAVIEHIEEAGLQYLLTPLLTFHDAIDFEVCSRDEKVVRSCADILEGYLKAAWEQLMRRVVERGGEYCPIKVDVEIGESWGSLTSLDDYFGK